MKKRKVEVVSTKEGVSFLFDKKYKYKYFFTGEHMTGDEVAEYLEMSGSAVSQSLETGLSKIYFRLKRVNKKQLSPIEIMFLMVSIFGVKSEKECKKFFYLFSCKIRNEVRMSARHFEYDRGNEYKLNHIVNKLQLHPEVYC